MVLGFALKLYPNRVKADLLALLAAEFVRLHRVAIDRLAGDWPRTTPRLGGLKQAGTGEFAQKAARRAVLDLQRQRAALRNAKRLCPYPPPLPYLRAELIGCAEVRISKTVEFDYWIHVEGTGHGNQLNIPAKSHAALNRALALPGANLGVGAEIFRRDGEWYARVYVHVPPAEVAPVKSFIGVDVGVRAAVTRSDGKQSRGLRRTLNKTQNVLAARQRARTERRKSGLSTQCQRLAGEARRLVTFARERGLGIALENPDRLIRWKQHAARYFAKRVSLLASMVGLPVVFVNPAWTSRTCSRCGSRMSDRQRTAFHCFSCGHTANADVNASRVIASRGTSVYIRAEHRA